MKYKLFKLKTSRSHNTRSRERAANMLAGIGDRENPHPDTLIPTPDEGDPFENADLQHLGLFFYLIPVVGFFPALWTLYRGTGSQEQRVASRLAVTLAFSWLAGYILLETGARTSEFLTLPLLLTSSALTSSYFLVNVWLMIRLSQRRSLRLPWITRIAEQVVGKRLS